MGITNIPMLNGEIVMGISLMLLFIICRIQLGFGTILMAHITFNVPYVILSVMPKLKQTNKSTYEAALDLGASPLYAFWKVIFPDIMPGVVSGFLLSFTMSLDDFVITYFTKGPGVDTLSTKIYAEVRKGIKPEMYSLSTILCHRTASAAPCECESFSEGRKRGGKRARGYGEEGHPFPHHETCGLPPDSSDRHGACHRRRRYLLRKPECFSRRLPAADCVQLGRIYGF